jgi:hypothetical protein
MIDNIGKYLSEVIEAVYGDRLKNFISRNPADQWFIASDYVIGEMINLDDVEDGITELERAVRLGLAGAMILPAVLCTGHGATFVRPR